MAEKRKDLTGFFIILVILTLMNIFFLTKYQKPKEDVVKPSPEAGGTEKAADLTLAVDGQDWQAEFFLENEQLKVGFNSLGGSVVSCQLKKYHPGIVPQDREPVFLSHNGLITALPRSWLDHPPKFRLQKITQNEIVWTAGVAGVRLIKTYILPAQGYLLKQTIQTSPTAIDQAVVVRPFFEELGTTKQSLATQALYWTGDKKGQLKSDSDSVTGLRWIGLSSKYFLAAIIPGQKEGISARGQFEAANALGLNLRYLSSSPVSFDVFLGPKEYTVLKNTGYGLEKSIDLGWVVLEPISLLMLNILNFFYSYAKNYGLAIILLTILVKLALWPLTAKSFSSMQAMQKIQPHLKKIQEKYKGEPDKLQPEMMKLYKEHGVNPLGGCLPSLLQLPIFFALFATLNNTIELRGAPFLWISDLSRPDTVFYLGPLPINILPIMMGLTMFWQQAQMPSTSDQNQKMMFMLMPVLMTVLFYGFPAGLTLYWFVFNLLTIAHQQLMLGRSKSKQPI